MSVKIRVSYTDDEELAGIIRLLALRIKSCKRQSRKGKYKRAYIELNREESPNKAGGGK